MVVTIKDDAPDGTYEIQVENPSDQDQEYVATLIISGGCDLQVNDWADKPSLQTSISEHTYTIGGEKGEVTLPPLNAPLCGQN